MKTLALFTSLSQRLSSLRRDQRGVSAVEFAMLLPLMVTLYLGTVEVSQGVSINRKVTLTARTVADLASQVSSINNTEMTNMLNAASAVVSPFPANQLRVTVSAVCPRQAATVSACCVAADNRFSLPTMSSTTLSVKPCPLIARTSQLQCIVRSS